MNSQDLVAFPNLVMFSSFPMILFGIYLLFLFKITIIMQRVYCLECLINHFPFSKFSHKYIFFPT